LPTFPFSRDAESSERSAFHADSAPLRGLCVAANRVVACRSLRRFYNYRSIPATLQGDES